LVGAWFILDRVRSWPPLFHGDSTQMHCLNAPKDNAALPSLLKGGSKKESSYQRGPEFIRPSAGFVKTGYH
jgi:hypothetical protein